MKSVGAIILARAELIALAATQRERLADQLHVLETPATVFDFAVGGLQWLRAHPGAALLGAGVMVILVPGRIFRIARGCIVLWHSWNWAYSRLREKRWS